MSKPKQRVLSTMVTGNYRYRTAVSPSTTWPGAEVFCVEMKVGTARYELYDSQMFPLAVRDSGEHNRGQKWALTLMTKVALRNAGVGS